jgi:hypothetical protein
MAETWFFVAHPDEGSRPHFRNVMLDRIPRRWAIPPSPQTVAAFTDVNTLNRALVLSLETSHSYQLSNSEMSMDLCTFSRFGT